MPWRVAFPHPSWSSVLFRDLWRELDFSLFSFLFLIRKAGAGEGVVGWLFHFSAWWAQQALWRLLATGKNLRGKDAHITLLCTAIAHSSKNDCRCKDASGLIWVSVPLLHRCNALFGIHDPWLRFGGRLRVTGSFHSRREDKTRVYPDILITLRLFRSFQKLACNANSYVR